MAKSKRSFWLIRHAESEYNQLVPNQARIGGRSDHLKLTPRGERQAAALAARIQRLQAARRIHLHPTAFTSIAVRARHTAEIVLGQLTPKLELALDERLVERGMGEAEGQNVLGYYTVERRLDLSLRGPDWKAKDGESHRETGHRMYAAILGIEERTSPGETVLIFTHGLAIRSACAEILGTGWGLVGKNPNENTSISELILDDEVGWVCGRLNDASHLEALEDT